jgi:putative membrane protein
LLAFSVFAASMLCEAFGLGFKVSVHSAAGVITLLIGVAVWGLLNATLGKLLKLLTLPLSCITLGLFSLVVNAIILLIAASLELGFEITDTGPKAFLSAFVASLLIAFISGVLGVFVSDDEGD